MGIKERKEKEKNKRGRHIQQAAKELFLLKGFRATTMEDIANKAELSPATIYLYFKNKEELYCSLNLIGLQFLTDEIKIVCDNNHLTAEEKMFEFKDVMYKSFIRDPLRFKVILHVQMEDILLSIDKKLLEYLNHFGKQIMKMIADTYEEGVQQGKFIKGNSMAYADIIWSIFTGLVLWEESKNKINSRKDFLEPTLDWAFDILVRGIRKR